MSFCDYTLTVAILTVTKNLIIYSVIERIDDSEPNLLNSIRSGRYGRAANKSVTFQTEPLIEFPVTKYEYHFIIGLRTISGHSLRWPMLLSCSKCVCE